MAHHARIEEVSDSDSDPPEMDVADFDPSSLIAPASIPSSAPAQMLQPQAPSVRHTRDREQSKHYQCLYPVYFDVNRTRAQGRRVGRDLAVPNPLAREMADAASSLGLRTVFEPDKTHPKDWANPGRIRILLKEEGKHVARNVKNKHHLYILVSQYLKQHPTTPEAPLKLRIAGIPLPKDGISEPAIPRGWKMNTILPLHSPAMSGGGVSENFLQEMMTEMQGEAGGSAASSGGEGKKKKEKKKK